MAIHRVVTHIGLRTSEPGDVYVSFVHVKVVVWSHFVPLFVPVEIFGYVGPESSRILDGSCGSEVHGTRVSSNGCFHTQASHASTAIRACFQPPHLRYISSYCSLLFTCAFSANACGGGYVAPSMSVFPSSSKSSAKDSDWSSARKRGSRVPGQRDVLLAHLLVGFARANAGQCACARIQSSATHARMAMDDVPCTPEQIHPRGRRCTPRLLPRHPGRLVAHLRTCRHTSVVKARLHNQRKHVVEAPTTREVKSMHACRCKGRRKHANAAVARTSRPLEIWKDLSRLSRRRCGAI